LKADKIGTRSIHESAPVRYDRSRGSYSQLVSNLFWGEHVSALAVAQNGTGAHRRDNSGAALTESSSVANSTAIHPHHVTVLIPAHNEAASIADTLNSLQQQVRVRTGWSWCATTAPTRPLRSPPPSVPR
jgi:hypothetical protein